MPEAIVCLSDMAFDSCDGGYRTNYQILQSQYASAGYKMPRVIFWNLRGNTDALPVTKDEAGVTMISGYSQHLLKAVIESGGESIPTPEQIMLKTLNGERYAQLKA
jgi:hypothetical protein